MGHDATPPPPPPQFDGGVLPPPAWAPPPPPRSGGVPILTVVLPAVLVAAGALGAVLLVRQGGGAGGGGTTLSAPDVIEGEHRLDGGGLGGAISSLQDVLKKADPRVRSVVFAAYGTGSVPDHMLFAETGAAEDPTTGLQAFTGASLPSFGGVSMGIGPATVVTSDRESFTCFTAAAQGLPQALAMTMCFWSDQHPATAGGVVCLASGDPRSCADYAVVARKEVIPG